MKEMWGEGLEIHGNLLARNTVLNFVGQAIPALVAVITIPYVIGGLGVERFGILSLTWVILGYLSLFDLGLAQATTKFVAEALGGGRDGEIRSIVGTAIVIQTGFAIITSIALVLCTPLLVERVFRIPSALTEETKITLYILGTAVPIAMFSAMLRGVLAAGQHFGVINLVRIISGSANFLIPALAVSVGAGLFWIVLLLVGLQLVLALLTVRVVLKKFAALKRGLLVDKRRASEILRYGVWSFLHVTVASFLPGLDRLFIGSRLAVENVGYYSIVYEIVSRIGMIPASVVMAVFPAFSAMLDRRRLEALYCSSMKYLLIAMISVDIGFLVFAREIMRVWLGDIVALKGTLPLRLLLMANLIGSATQLSITLLQSRGRPDLVAKVLALEVPFYLGFSWYMIGQVGITGAAIAWLSLIVVNACVFFVAAARIVELRWQSLVESLLVESVLVGGFVVVAGLGVVAFADRNVVAKLGVLFLVCFFLYYGAKRLITEREKKVFWGVAASG